MPPPPRVHHPHHTHRSPCHVPFLSLPQKTTTPSPTASFFFQDSFLLFIALLCSLPFALRPSLYPDQHRLATQTLSLFFASSRSFVLQAATLSVAAPTYLSRSRRHPVSPRTRATDPDTLSFDSAAHRRSYISRAANELRLLDGCLSHSLRSFGLINC